MAVAAAVLGPLGWVSAAPAQAAASDAEQHCVIVLDGLRPGQSSSRILSRTCADDSQASALREARASTLLMTWYDGEDYGGASTQLRGDDGGCNTAGYGVEYVGDDWNDRISSYRVFNNCWFTKVYPHINYGGKMTRFPGDHSSVGIYDNKISSLWVTA